MKGVSKAVEKRFIGVKEMSEYLGLAEGTLYVWVCRKRIPHLKIGKALRFDMREIEGWLKDKRIKELT